MITVLLLSLVNDEKNTLGLLAILMNMWMRRCNAAHIARWITTRASRRVTGHCHQAITCTILPRSVHHVHQQQQHNKHNNKKHF